MSNPTTAHVTAADLIGQTVITINSDSPTTFLGIDDSGFEHWVFGGNTGVHTSFDYVAPADTPIPAKDDRVTATKRTIAEARRYGHYGRGAWSYTLDGDPQQRVRWANTKTEALAKGARRLAIMDWHARNAAAAETPAPETAAA